MSQKALEAARSLVEALEAEAKPFTIPDPEISLAGALRRLKAIPGTKNHGVHLNITDYGSGNTVVRWEVWDGTRFTGARTLLGAVMACEESNRPSKTPEKVQATVDGAIEPPF